MGSKQVLGTSDLWEEGRGRAPCLSLWERDVLSHSDVSWVFCLQAGGWWGDE